jgi:hypothetical protein
MSRAARVCISLIVIFVVLPRVNVEGRLPPLRLIAAANVTVRKMPSAQAPVVAQLPLGTEVSEAGGADLDKTWVHIYTPDGKEGWVKASLTRPLDPATKAATQEKVIANRLTRNGDGFRAGVELVNFIERIADSFTDAESRARMDLYHLKALQQTLSAIPFNAAKREPYASWLNDHKEVAFYDEPGGEWMLNYDAIWKIHEARAKTSAADEIAWFSTTVGLGGECEGYLPCYFDARDRLLGQYLRTHPAGAHVNDAIAGIGETAILLSAPPGPGFAYEFDPAKDCSAVVASIDALRRAIEGAKTSPDREATLTSLAYVRRKCQ